jgi:hypothetical protein
MSDSGRNETLAQGRRLESLIQVAENISSIVHESHAMLRSQNSTLRQDEHEEILRWLPITCSVSNYKQARDKHVAETGEWFLESNAFKSWKTDPDSFLWVQTSTQRWLELQGETAKRQEEALKVLTAAFLSSDYGTWLTYEALPPYAQAVIRYIFTSGLNLLQRSELLRNMSSYDMAKGQYNLAYERGLDALST